jgi:hypothetical protein
MSRDLNLKPEAKWICPKCANTGVVLNRPLLMLERCVCVFGDLPGLLIGPVHPDDLIASE